MIHKLRWHILLWSEKIDMELYWFIITPSEINLATGLSILGYERHCYIKWKKVFPSSKNRSRMVIDFSAESNRKWIQIDENNKVIVVFVFPAPTENDTLSGKREEIDSYIYCIFSIFLAVLWNVSDCFMMNSVLLSLIFQGKPFFSMVYRSPPYCRPCTSTWLMRVRYRSPRATKRWHGWFWINLWKSQKRKWVFEVWECWWGEGDERVMGVKKSALPVFCFRFENVPCCWI